MRKNLQGILAAVEVSRPKRVKGGGGHLGIIVAAIATPEPSPGRGCGHKYCGKYKTETKCF